MAIPKYYEYYGEFLKVLADGDTHSIKEIKDAVATAKHISGSELTDRLPSGKQTVFDNRIGWTRTYLKKAGLIESPSRGLFKLTDEGKTALKDADDIDDDYLMRFPSFKEFKRPKGKDEAESLPETSMSPEELLEKAFEEMNDSLADDLMSEIMKLTPSNFEELVVQLLMKMGYGSGIDDAGVVTQASNDGGIDGIIKEDQLGFSSIYIQAKQWDPHRTVDRPEVQKFAGALQEMKAQKGLFITTASFTKGARTSADSAGIVLVDGKQLTRLMIKHNLGVSTEHVYEVKRLDTDFFADRF